MSFMNILSLMLIAMTIFSYIPQYYRLLILGSSTGLSIASVLITTLVPQVQMATMWFLFKSAPLMRYNIPIATPTSTRNWLNLAQIVTQWVCSLIFFALVIYLPNSSPESPDPAVLSKIAAVLLLLLYILLCFILMPKGPVDDLAFNLMRNLHAVIANYVFTFLLTMSFLFQVHIMPSYGQTNALSKWTLALQSFTFLLLAISWPFRLILPPNMWEHGLKPAVLMEWYPWVGWACVNSAIMAIGQGVLLFISSRGGVGGSIGLVGEDEILLVRAWK